MQTHPTDGAVELVVSDDGHGMSEEDINRVRQRHQKGDTSEGNGLGLTLMAEECDRLGVSLQIDSEPGRGTRIVIGLPEA